MTAFNKESSAEANARQKEKYEDFTAEMRRRGGMRVKTPPQNTPEYYRNKSNEMRRRAKIRWEKHAAKQNQTES